MKRLIWKICDHKWAKSSYAHMVACDWSIMIAVCRPGSWWMVNVSLFKMTILWYINDDQPQSSKDQGCRSILVGRGRRTLNDKTGEHPRRVYMCSNTTTVSTDWSLVLSRPEVRAQTYWVRAKSEVINEQNTVLFHPIFVDHEQNLNEFGLFGPNELSFPIHDRHFRT